MAVSSLARVPSSEFLPGAHIALAPTYTSPSSTPSSSTTPIYDSLPITGNFLAAAPPMHQFLSLGKTLRDRLDSGLLSTAMHPPGSRGARAQEEKLRAQWGTLGWTAVDVWDQYKAGGFQAETLPLGEDEVLWLFRNRGQQGDVVSIAEDVLRDEGSEGSLRRAPSETPTEVVEHEEPVEEHSQQGACAELEGFGVKVRDYGFTGPHSVQTAFKGEAAVTAQRLEVVVRDEDVRMYPVQRNVHTGGTAGGIWADDPDPEEVKRMFWNRTKDALAASTSQLLIDGKKRRSGGEEHPDSPKAKRSKLLRSPPKRVVPRHSRERLVSPPPEGLTEDDGFEYRGGLGMMGNDRELTPLSDDEPAPAREVTPIDDEDDVLDAEPVQRRAPPLARPTRLGLGRQPTLRKFGVAS